MHSLLLFIAQYLIVLIGLTAFVYWLTLPKKVKLRSLVFGLIAAVITYGLVKLGGAVFYDPRPFVQNPHLIPLFPHGPDNGFPSDHMALGAYTAFVIFSVSKRMGVLLLVLAILIGVARVIGHIHSPIDIIGSLVFAFIGYLVAWALTPRIFNYLERSK
ncbi:MAG TPA: phosphatase PAP2 family protein [Candidatus Saccharimonadales bacterium]